MILQGVTSIIKQASGNVFFYGSGALLLESICKTKELRREVIAGVPSNTLQFTFSDAAPSNIEFEVNYITYIEYAPGYYQEWPNLGPTPEPSDLIQKLDEVYSYLSQYVFQCCCDDGMGTSPFPYPSNTYANWLIALNAGVLPKGLWIEVTEIPSQPGAIFAMFCTEDNQIALGGFGQFLNADWQNVGDYSGVFDLTGVVFTTNKGQWYSGFEYITIDYTNLMGGTFAVGDTVTDTTTTATGTVISDDGVSQMVIEWTSYGTAFGVANTIDNGSGVTADITAITYGATTGDVAIWNGLHYQVIDESLIDGTDPATNTSAYTLLPITTANMGYILEQDEIEFDFVPDWLQLRSDNRGNRYAYSQETDTTEFSLGFTAINQFQWGRDATFANLIEESNINSLNSVGEMTRSTFMNVSTFTGNTQMFSVGGFFFSSGSLNNTIINAVLSVFRLHNSGILNCQFDQVVTGFNFTNASLENKIFTATNVSWLLNGVNLSFSETISSNLGGISIQGGLSTYPQTIDITGLTTLDLSTVEQAGIYTITSSNATETIDTITGFPTLFPITLKPDTGLDVTITFTPFASLANNDEIVGATASLILYGDRGDFLTLKADTLSGFSVTRQINASSIA